MIGVVLKRGRLCKNTKPWTVPGRCVRVCRISIRGLVKPTKDQPDERKFSGIVQNYAKIFQTSLNLSIFFKAINQHPYCIVFRISYLTNVGNRKGVLYMSEGSQSKKTVNSKLLVLYKKYPTYTLVKALWKER
jgi:hypothetical protein